MRCAVAEGSALVGFNARELRSAAALGLRSADVEMS